MMRMEEGPFKEGGNRDGKHREDWVRQRIKKKKWWAQKRHSGFQSRKNGEREIGMRSKGHMDAKHTSGVAIHVLPARSRL
jgi:hypothetical protein